MDLENLKTIDNPSENRFELSDGNDTAIIDYKIGKSGGWYLVHTEVPKQWQGMGAGQKIVREALQILEDRKVKIIPTCPFIKAYIKRHYADYKHLLAENVKL